MKYLLAIALSACAFASTDSELEKAKPLVAHIAKAASREGEMGNYKSQTILRYVATDIAAALVTIECARIEGKPNTIEVQIFLDKLTLHYDLLATVSGSLPLRNELQDVIDNVYYENTHEAKQ